MKDCKPGNELAKAGKLEKELAKEHPLRDDLGDDIRFLLIPSYKFNLQPPCATLVSGVQK